MAYSRFSDWRGRAGWGDPGVYRSLPPLTARLNLGRRSPLDWLAGTFVVDVTAAGGAVPRLLWHGTTAPTWCWAQDGGLALATDVEVAGQAELFWVRDLTLPTFAKISGPLVEGGRVHSCAFPSWVD